MDDVFGLFSQRSGLSSDVASMGLSLVSKFLLRNAEPQRASGFMSMLPSSITNMFSNDEKQDLLLLRKMYLKMKLLNKYLEIAVMEIEKKENRFIKKQLR